jgi:hypothetical protein
MYEGGVSVMKGYSGGAILRVFRLAAVFTVLSLALAAVPAFGQEPFTFEPRMVFDALRLAYGDLIEGMAWEEGEAYFVIRGQRIFFQDGKMLSAEHLPEAERYDPILYPYMLGPLKKPPDPVAYPFNRSNDFFEALVGGGERQIAAACRWVPFLNHRVFVHESCIESLERIDRSLLELASSSAKVRSYIEDIKIIFSLDRREVHGTDHLSVHSYGIALDIVPREYGGKQVYWRWSNAWNKNWEKMDLSQRWHPPDQVIEAFEREGFVWGGKWYHFDTIHFEYRPEIIALNRLRYGVASGKE